MINKIIKYVLIFLLLALPVLVSPMNQPASKDSTKGDVLVHLRLYEGWRSIGLQKSTVVSTYYLKPLFVSNLVSVMDLNEEGKELKRIFNLADIRLMTQTQLGWQEGISEKRFKMMVLNGHEFQVQLTMMDKKDDFKVEVLDRGQEKQKPLLETVVTLPEKKSTVFGFEDSLRKPFFICLQREANQSVIIKEPKPVPENKDLKRIKYISPKYPEPALKNKIQGIVLIDAAIDQEGKPIDLFVVSGPEELHQAAVDAVKQWRWEPIKSEDTDEPIKATMTVKFEIPDDETDKPELMDFQFENESLFNVLKYVAQKTNFNLVVDPDVDLNARVSCQLNQTSWEDALDWMLQLHDLDMLHKGNVVRILKKNPANRNLAKASKEKKYTGKPMDFNFKNADLKDILNIIAKIDNLKMDIAPGIKGRVSVQMKQVPWDQFLDLVLELNGLKSEVNGNVYKITKKKLAPQKTEKQKDTSYIPNIFPSKGYLSSGYGTRKHPLTKKIEFHKGIDIAAKIGSQVIAPANGVVTSINKKDKEYGESITIDHGNGYSTYYRGISQFKVKKGDKVKKGQVIAFIGKTNKKWSTGPHLHYEVRFHDKPINPMSLIQLQ